MTIGRVFVATGIVLALLALAGVAFGLSVRAVEDLAIVAVGVGVLAP